MLNEKIKQILTAIPNNFKQNFLPVLIVLIGVGFSGQQYWSAKQNADSSLNARFTVAFNEATLKIAEKIEAYEQMLRATQGLFYASESVSRQEFREYTQELELNVFYSGLLGLGYVPLIKPEDKAEHIAEVRADGFPEYRIYPEGERSFYTSILYLEPFSERNLRAFGYDMASEPNRREAMLYARDKRLATLTSGVKLVQDLASESTTGLLMYLPLFQNMQSGRLESENRGDGEHHGWVYVVFRIEDVVNSSLASNSNVSHFRIKDITDEEPQTLYQSSSELNEQLGQATVMRLGGRLWQFEAAPDKQFIANYRDQSPLVGLFLGVFFSIALAYISWLITHGRIRAENRARQMTRQLREQNQRLSLATEAAHLGVWDWDFANDQFFIDKNLTSFMRVKLTENHRIPASEFYHSIDIDDRPRLQNAIDETIKHRQELNIKVRLNPEQSLKRMIQLNAVLKFDNEGQPFGMLGVGFDITDSWLHQQQLEETEARWKHALEGSGEGVWDWWIEDNRILFSEKMTTMLGFEPGEFHPDLDEWLARIHPDDKAQVEKDVDALLDDNQTEYINEHRLLCKDGSWKWVLARGTVIERDADGQPLRAVGTHDDINQRKENEIKLRQSEERFRNAFDTAPIGMALVSVEGRWLEVNETLCELLGYEESELLQLTFADITHPDDLALDQQYVNRLIKGDLHHYQMEKRYLQKNSQILDVLLSVSVVHDNEGKVLHFVSQIEDITARKREDERIRTLAFQDSLTGLPNRRLFDERISHGLKTSTRNKQKMALMFIDIDHFKHINDSYGHDVGDEVIKKVADEMRSALRASDTLARLGGDEFVVLLNDVPSSEVSLMVAENLREPFNEPLQLESCAIRITLSIGVAIWTPEQNDGVINLMKKADIALYEVKARGRDGVSLYQSSSSDT